jgi:hypothetical protein
VLSALFVALLTLMVSFTRERYGERLLPWSSGTTHTANLSVQARRWWPILRSTLTALTRPVSLPFLPIMPSRTWRSIASRWRILDEDERGPASGMMFGGQSIGIALVDGAQRPDDRHLRPGRGLPAEHRRVERHAASEEQGRRALRTEPVGG